MAVASSSERRSDMAGWAMRCRRALPSARQSATRAVASYAALIGVVVDEAHDQRAQQDPDIEAQRPVLDVVDIVLDALVHRLDARRLAAPAIDLRPAGDARLHAMAAQIAVDDLG